MKQHKYLVLIFLGMICAPVLALNTPTPTAPADNVTSAYTRQSFRWSSVDGAASYQLQVDTCLAFNSPLLVNQTFSSSPQTVYHFHFNTRYYWRVRAMSKNSDEYSNWSAVFTFTTLSRPTLISPNDSDATGTFYPKQTLQWKNSYGCTEYRIEIDTTETFSSPAKRSFTSINFATNKDEKLSENVSDCYLKCFNYWRVKAYNNNDSSAWSEVYRFHTLSRAKIISPDGLTTAFTTQNLRWEYYKGLSKVIIEIDTTATFSSPALQTLNSFGNNSDDCYTTITNLYFGTMYYWRLCSYNANDTTDWSNTLSFTTYRHCTLNASPADGATGVSVSPKIYFDYTSGISNYQMQLDTTPAFDSPLLQSHIEQASSASMAYHSYSGLLYGTTYYRRVRECHRRDTSDWSPVRSFTTKYLLSQPTLAGPANQTGVPEQEEVILSWDTCKDAMTYLVQVSLDGQFADLVYQATTTECQITVADLPTNSILYWRMCAINEQGRSPWSPIWSFSRTGTVITDLMPHETVTTPSCSKFIRAGRLYIQRGPAWYNPLGQPIR